MRPRARAVAIVLAAGMLVLALTGSSGKQHGNPHATTTTVAPTTSSATTTTAAGDPVDAFAAQLGFPTRNLTVSDEFNGTTVDTTRWGAKSYSPGTAVHWNGYTNATVANGVLDIAATRRSDGLWDSTFLSGLHPYSGPRFVDVRAKVPAGNGTWAGPAWEWSAPWGAAPGPELDVNEQLGREPTEYHATAHYWDSNGGDHQVSTAIPTGVNLADGYHDYGMAVRADRVEFYFDFRLVHTVLRADWPSTWVFDIAQVVLNVDLDMGGAWAGPVDPALPSPVHQYVDYERVYQP